MAQKSKDLAPSKLSAILAGMLQGLSDVKKEEDERAQAILKQKAELTESLAKERGQMKRELAVAKTKGVYDLLAKSVTGEYGIKKAETAGILDILGITKTGEYMLKGKKVAGEYGLAKEREAQAGAAAVATIGREGRRGVAELMLADGKYRVDKAYDADVYDADKQLEGIIYSSDQRRAAMEVVANIRDETNRYSIDKRDEWESDKIAASKDIAESQNAVDRYVAELRARDDLTSKQKLDIQRHGKMAQTVWALMSMAYTTEDRGLRNELIELTADASQYVFTDYITNVYPAIGGKPMAPLFKAEDVKKWYQIKERRGLKVETPSLPAPAPGERQLQTAGKEVDDWVNRLSGEGKTSLTAEERTSLTKRNVDPDAVERRLKAIGKLK